MRRYSKKLCGSVFLAVCLSLLMAGSICHGKDARRAEFLEKSFQGPVPAPDHIWITASVRPVVESVLGHEFNGLRIKYWREGNRSVWILEDMAKEQPVRVGIVVSQGKIRGLEILSAEGRWGSLIKNETFTGQFENAASDENNRLTRAIDGISGATISVHTVSRLAQLALLLDRIRQAE